MPERLAAALAGAVAAWPGPGAAGVVSRRGVDASAGAAERAFPWASVTKLLVALSCLVASEEGTVGLDDAVGPPGSTLAHLLAHASGLPFEGLQPVAPPAHRRIYSNTGMELAAEHLEARSGMHFGDYLRVGVLSPLGMNGTFFEGFLPTGPAGPSSTYWPWPASSSPPPWSARRLGRPPPAWPGPAWSGCSPALAAKTLATGAWAGDPRPQVPALDRPAQFAVHVRPFRPVGIVALGRP